MQNDKQKNPQSGVSAQKPAAGSHDVHDKSAKLNAEVKKVWSKLTDDDMKLIDKQPEQFFGKIKEKYGTGKDEAQKRLNEIKTSCGCGTEKAA